MIDLNKMKELAFEASKNNRLLDGINPQAVIEMCEEIERLRGKLQMILEDHPENTHLHVQEALEKSPTSGEGEKA